MWSKHMLCLIYVHWQWIWEHVLVTGWMMKIVKQPADLMVFIIVIFKSLEEAGEINKMISFTYFHPLVSFLTSGGEMLHREVVLCILVQELTLPFFRFHFCIFI